MAFSGVNIFAQYGSFGVADAQSIGMGNSFGSSFGVLSLGKNPALLDYPQDTSGYVAVQFPNFAFKAIESSMTLDDFNNYFNYPTSKNLNDAEKQAFFESFGEDNGFYFHLGSDLLSFAVKPTPTFGTIAFSVTDYMAGTLKVPLTMVDLLINGNAQNRTYEFDDMSFKAWWIKYYTLSYAREIMKFDDDFFIKRLSGGISLKYVHGIAYAGVENFDAFLKTGANNALTGRINYLANSAFSTDLGINYDFADTDYKNNASLFNEPAGSGLGFDIGFAADLDNHIRVGLSITDIGSITWDKNAAEYKANGDIYITDLFDKDQQNDLENFLDDSSYAVNSFSTSLPTALRLNIAYDISKSIGIIPGDLILQLAYNQGFNDMPGNSLTPRLALGARWKTLSWIPIVSTGLSNDHSGDIVWTFGLGYSTEVLDFAIATHDMISFMSTSRYPHLSLAMNFVWRFGF